MRCMTHILMHDQIRLDCDRRAEHEGPHRDSTHLLLWTDQAQWPELVAA